jgi:hypothetical protein
MSDILPSPLYEAAWASRFTGSLLGTPPRADTGCPSVWLQQIPATPFFAASTIVSFGDSSLTHFTRCLAALFWGEASHRHASHPMPALRDGVVLSRLRAKALSSNLEDFYVNILWETLSDARKFWVRSMVRSQI